MNETSRREIDGKPVERSHKSLPKEYFDEQTEAQLLGASIPKTEDAEQLELMLSVCTENHFTGRNRKVFRAIKRITDRGSTPTITILNADLRQHENQDVASYAVDISTNYISKWEFVGLLEIVDNYAERRRNHDIFARALQRTRDPDGDMESLKEKVVQALYHRDGTKADLATTPYDEYDSVIERARDAEANDGLVGHTTGFQKIDQITGGIVWGDYWLVAADTSVGKTAFSLDLARHLSFHNDVPGLYLFVEGAKQKIVRRLIAKDLNIPLEHLKSGQLTNKQWSRLDSHKQELENSPLYLKRFAGKHADDLAGTVSRFARFHGIKYVVLDYLQKVDGKGSNRESRVDYVSTVIQQVASIEGVAMIVNSQLTLPSGKSNKRPYIEHVRYSKTPGHDADVTAMIYRPEVYDITYCEVNDMNTKGMAEIIFRKLREGERNQSAVMSFAGQYGKFHNALPSSRAVF